MDEDLKNALKMFFCIVCVGFAFVFAYKFYDIKNGESNVVSTNTTDTSDFNQLFKPNRNQVNQNKQEDIVIKDDNSSNTTVIIPTVEENHEENIEQNVAPNNSSIKNNRYYYNQLNGYAKKIYDAIVNNIDKLKVGNSRIDISGDFSQLLNTENGQKALNVAYDEAVNAINLDIPNLFYLDFSKMYLNIETTTSLFTKKNKLYIDCGNEPNYFSSGFNSAIEVKMADGRIETSKAELIKDIKDASPYDKIKKVHDYIINNFEYNQDGVNKNTVYGAMIEKKCVCEGYARSFKYILNDLGINTILVVGVGKNSSGRTESHMWNYVELEGKWYAVDATWDDPIVYGGGTVGDEVKHKYFLLGSVEFSKNHVANQTISVGGSSIYLPTLSDSNY